MYLRKLPQVFFRTKGGREKHKEKTKGVLNVVLLEYSHYY